MQDKLNQLEREMFYLEMKDRWTETDREKMRALKLEAAKIQKEMEEAGE